MISTDQPKAEICRWTHEATLTLISAYQQYTKIPPKELTNVPKWKLIAATLEKMGYKYTSRQCDFKFKTLKRNYTKARYSKATGEEYVFNYFDKMNEMFQDTPLDPLDSLETEDIPKELHKKTWSRKAVHALIQARKDCAKIFNNQSLDNFAKWKIISNLLESSGFRYNYRQCEFKFKNLRKIYIHQKEEFLNLAKPITFEYFNDMAGLNVGRTELKQEQNILESTDRWSGKAILALIQVYKEQNCKDTRSQLKWEKIYEGMAEKGFNYTKKQCKLKFRYLYRKYLVHKDDLEPNSFEYHQQFKEIFCKKQEERDEYHMITEMIEKLEEESENQAVLRHNELMEKHEIFLNDYCEQMDLVIAKLEKRN